MKCSYTKYCKSPVVDGRRVCQHHQELQNTYQRSKRAERRSQGICIVGGCGKPVAIGSKGKPIQACTEHDEQRRIYQQRWALGIRRQILAAYGDKCSCCGEDNTTFLSIDHVNGDGYLTKNRTPLIVWQNIIRAGFPPEFQILCYNCNFAKRNNPVCPHQVEECYQYIGDSMLRALGY